MSVEIETQSAIFSRLSSYAPLSGISVVDHVPQPPDTGSQPFPYIVIGDDSFGAWDTDDSVGMDGEVVIHVWSRERGKKQVKTIQGHIYAALHRHELSISGQLLVTAEFVSSESFLDPDGLTRHGVSRFRVLVDQQ